MAQQASIEHLEAKLRVNLTPSLAVVRRHPRSLQPRALELARVLAVPDLGTLRVNASRKLNAGFRKACSLAPPSAGMRSVLAFGLWAYGAGGARPEMRNEKQEALLDIKEAELQAAKDAERAALNAKAPAKAGAKAKAEAKAEVKPAAAAEKADAATMAEIDAALAGSGKDAAAAKAGAVERLTAMASQTPFVLPRLEKLVALFKDSKLGGPAIKAASAIVDGVMPKGHGVAAVAVPVLLAGMESKEWKIKAGCIEVMLPCIRQMDETTPAQLAQCLPLIVPRLAECALEVRAEVRTATTSVLRDIG
ncbi:unnamed protein product, partial [Prorocentrum cordatum]